MENNIPSNFTAAEKKSLYNYYGFGGRTLSKTHKLIPFRNIIVSCLFHIYMPNLGQKFKVIVKEILKKNFNTILIFLKKFYTKPSDWVHELWEEALKYDIIPSDWSKEFLGLFDYTALSKQSVISFRCACYLILCFWLIFGHNDINDNDMKRLLAMMTYHIYGARVFVIKSQNQMISFLHGHEWNMHNECKHFFFVFLFYFIFFLVFVRTQSVFIVVFFLQVHFNLLKKDSKKWTFRALPTTLVEKFRVGSGYHNHTMGFEQQHKPLKKGYQYTNKRYDCEMQMQHRRRGHFSVQSFLYGIHIIDGKYVTCDDSYRFNDLPQANAIIDRNDFWIVGVLLIESEKKNIPLTGIRYRQKRITRQSFKKYDLRGNNLIEQRLSNFLQSECDNAWTFTKLFAKFISMLPNFNLTYNDTYILLTKIFSYSNYSGKHRIYYEKATNIYPIHNIYFYAKSYFNFTVRVGDPIKYKISDSQCAIGIVKAMYFIIDYDGWMIGNLFPYLGGPNINDANLINIQQNPNYLNQAILNDKRKLFPPNLFFWTDNNQRIQQFQIIIVEKWSFNDINDSFDLMTENKSLNPLSAPGVINTKQLAMINPANIIEPVILLLYFFCVFLFQFSFFL